MEGEKKKKWMGKKQISISVFTFFLFMLSSMISAGNTNTVYPYVSELRGWDLGILISTMAIIMFIMVAVTAILSHIASKVGAKIVCVVSLFVACAATAFMGVTQNLTVFLIIMFANGAAAGGYNSAVSGTLINNWFPVKKGVILGWVTMGMIITDCLYVPYITKVFDLIGIDVTYFIFAAIFLAMAIYCIIFIENTPEEAGTYPDGNPDGIPEEMEAIAKLQREYKSQYTVKKTLKTGVTWQIGIGFGLYWLAGVAYMAQIVPRLTSVEVGLSSDKAAFIVAIAGLFGLFGSWLFGWLDLKIGTKSTSIIYGIGQTLFLIGALLHPMSEIFCWFSCCGLMACIGGICNLIPSMIGTKFGRWDYASVYRVIYPICMIVSTFGMAAVSVIVNKGLSYSFIYIIGLAMTVIGLIIVITIDGKKMIGKTDEVVMEEAGVQISSLK